MARLDRAPRAAASALLLATAIGAAGTAGAASVLAVDPAATVALSGALVDGGGAPLGGVHLVVSEEGPPDGALAGFQVTTGADGSFAVMIYRWGTADAPARLTIRTPPDETIDVAGATCSQTWEVTVGDVRDLRLADTGDPLAPLALVATTTLRGEICGTTGKPPSAGGGGVGARVTPPPTDARATRVAASGERLGPALVLGFVLGLLVTMLLVVPRPRAPRRR